MAVSTGVNELLLDEMFMVYVAAEQEMLAKVAARVKKGVMIPGWNEQKLADVRGMRKELEDSLAKIHAKSAPGAASAVISSYLKGINSVEKDLKMPKTTLRTLSIPYHIQRLILESNEILKGASVQILRSTMDSYRSIVADSTAMMLTGVETRLQATQRALDIFASRGITGFVDKAGRNWDMTSYTEMAIRTTSARAALQGHIDRSTELDHDLMMVSSFGRTCPICAPWEGVVLSISGKTPNYRSLDEAKASGLFHPNCKHTLLAYFPDITEIPRVLQNDDSFYDATQKQRSNERQIRKWKRVEAVAITPEAKLKAGAKIRSWQTVQRELMGKFDLKRRYHREAIKNRSGNINNAKPIGPQTTKLNIAGWQAPVSPLVNPIKGRSSIYSSSIAGPMIEPEKIKVSKPKKPSIPFPEETIHHDSYKNKDLETLISIKGTLEGMLDKGSPGFKLNTKIKLEIVEHYIGEYKAPKAPKAPKKEPLVTKETYKPKSFNKIGAFNDLMEIVQTSNATSQQGIYDAIPLWLLRDLDHFKMDTLDQISGWGYDDVVTPKKIWDTKPVKLKKSNSKGADIDIDSIDFSGYKLIDNMHPDVQRDEGILDVMMNAYKSAVTQYTGSAYGDINRYRRNSNYSGITKSHIKISNDLEKAIKKNAKPLTDNTIIFRHINSDAMSSIFNQEIADISDNILHFNKPENLPMLQKKLAGATFHDPAFLSSSYAQGIFVKHRGVQVKMLMPKGFDNGIFVESVSNFASEREYIINAGQKFKIHSVDYDDVIENYGSDKTTKNLIINVVPI